ncbi:GNAT family N-acetyltransferase [Rhizobium sp. S95]|uniref:GNAT family N-acetyltransferase n=1 Tax=Ciceribacter sichuanensis TaxID=2949647 RepID=A0AAJ1BXU2_9HYPH|nr:MULTISPECIES: GNAT family N-acetyltransferase [unclassified Ciceribacter]MCM2397006.1 GNAT family N-acetyltransferase [Ciceribacter sp. S95]MCO5957902.1 GNAT family N-acetyltransferase [Ciceribacter sp. S101]
MPATEIRPLSPAEVATLVGWAGDEGWNPGLADASAFHAADPQGFLGCFVDGVLAAGISAVAYGTDFGFIGLYICHPDYRGKGYGRQVWDAGIAHLEGRTIGLDGVPEQQANYASMGFVPTYQTFRWSGRVTTPSPSSPSASTIKVCAATPDLLPAIGAFDSRFFPAERSAFLTEWLSAPRETFVATTAAGIAGYAVLRRCLVGYKLGPLFAVDNDAADALLDACLLRIGAEELQIDVPEAQETFSARLDRLGFTRGFATRRMYRGPAPAVEQSGVYGVTTLELG